MARKLLYVLSIAVVFFAIPFLLGQAPPRSPLDSLPDNVEVLTGFGERAAWSPKGDRIAFVHKSFGDAFEIDRRTKEYRCLTCDFRHDGFLRVQYLPSGDYILIGPKNSSDQESARWNDSEIWFLSSKPGSGPIRLGQKLTEGIAISRETNTVAWAVSSRQYPDEIGSGITQLWVAELDIGDGRALLTQKRRVHEAVWPDCWLEAQDFRNKNSELIFSCYQPEDNAEVMGVNLEDGTITNYTKSPDVYDEPEGIFPDGRSTLVESDLQNDKGDHYIDIWRLKLDGTGQVYERLTRFSDYSGYKASNPVVSPDGTMMAFQLAKSSDDPGVGYGILIMHFEAETGAR